MGGMTGGGGEGDMLMWIDVTPWQSGIVMFKHENPINKLFF